MLDPEGKCVLEQGSWVLSLTKWSVTSARHSDCSIIRTTERLEGTEYVGDSQRRVAVCQVRMEAGHGHMKSQDFGTVEAGAKKCGCRVLGHGYQENEISTRMWGRWDQSSFWIPGYGDPSGSSGSRPGAQGIIAG